jgi:hypothetical protein
MRLSSGLLSKSAAGVDLATAGLILGGVALIAASFVAASAMSAPTPLAAPSAAEITSLTPPGPTVASRPSVALSADQVATLLVVDAAAGAGSATRPGDRVDVVGYFPRQAIGIESVTRVLLEDVPVLTVGHSGPGVELTLAVPQGGALLLQEAQAIGARPFVMLRSVQVMSPAEGVPPSFSDADLAGRLAGVR